MPEQCLVKTYFLCKAHHSLTVLGNTEQHFSTTLGAVLNSKIPKKNKTQKGKKRIIYSTL